MTLPPGLDTLTEADIEAMIFKAEDYERLFDRVPLRVKKTGRLLAARRKQRSYRKRRANGVAVLKIEAPLYLLIEAMLTAGRLSPEQALQRSEVEREAGAILEEWRRHWEGLC